MAMNHISEKSESHESIEDKREFARGSLIHMLDVNKSNLSSSVKSSLEPEKVINAESGVLMATIGNLALAIGTQLYKGERTPCHSDMTISEENLEDLDNDQDNSTTP